MLELWDYCWKCKEYKLCELRFKYIPVCKECGNGNWTLNEACELIEEAHKLLITKTKIQ